MKSPVKPFSAALVIILLFLGSSPLFAFRTYMPEDPPARELRRLYTLEGRAFPVSGYPYSGAQLADLAGVLSEGSDNPAIRESARAVIASLNLPGKDEAVRGRTMDAGVETNIHDAYRWDPARAFHDRFVEFPEMFTLALFAEREGYPGLHISAGIEREYAHGDVPESNLFFASADDPFKIETYFIKTGYLAWENDVFSVRFGRSPVHYGDGRFSSFLPSDRLPFLDALEYRYKIGPVRMVSYFGTLENRMSAEEEAFFTGNISNNDYLTIDGSESDLVLGEDGWFYDTTAGPDNKLAGGFGRTIILSSMHRFVWELPKASFGVTAQMLIAREQNALQLADIFPVFSWHNGSVGSNNMLLLVDGLWSVAPGLDLYGQAGWDDINATDFIGIPDKGTIPTIGAYLLGLAWEGSLPQPVSASLEAGTTHYLWGNFYAWSDSVKDGIYFARSIYRYRTQKGIYSMPLTSPYGPGTSWIDGSISLGDGKGLSSELFASWLNRNTAASLISTDYMADDAIKNGDRVNSWASSLTGRYGFSIGESWQSSAYARLWYYNYDGFGWPEVELGIRVRGEKTFPF
jgi:hypothetical protein